MVPLLVISILWTIVAIALTIAIFFANIMSDATDVPFLGKGFLIAIWLIDAALWVWFGSYVR